MQMSKMKKEILIEAYKKGERQLGLFSSYVQYYLSEKEFKKLKSLAKSKNMSNLTRSVERLKNDGLIKFEKFINKREEPGENYIVLTYQGEKKAKMLHVEKYNPNGAISSKQPKKLDNSNGFFIMFKHAFDELTVTMNCDQKRQKLDELFNNMREYLSI